MPEFLGDILVVSKDELVPQFFSSYDALRMSLKRYEDKPYGIKRAMKGGNGRRLLVLFDTLPKGVQEKLKDPRKKDHPLEDRYTTNLFTRNYYQDYRYPDGRTLRPETIEKLIVNANVLQALVGLEADRRSEIIRMGGNLGTVMKLMYRDAVSFNKILLREAYGEIQHTLNSNYRRFKEQYKSFKVAYNESPKNGLKTLIYDAEGKAKQNALVIKGETAELLNNLFAGQDYKLNATEAARQYEAFLGGYIQVVNENTGELYDPKNFKTLSISAIKTYLRSYESKIGTHAKRSGDRQKLMQDFIPYESMERPVFAGSIISIDDRQPPFEYEKGTRMWWYIGIDLASEAIVAWAYGKTKKEKELILNFYKNLVANHHSWGVNLPIELECESSLNSSFKDTFLKDGTMFEKVNIHANSARSKMVERFFRELRYELEKGNLGWIARPFARSEANQAGPQAKTIIPYDKLVQQCFANIIEWNNRPKKGTNISRFDYFKNNQNPDIQPTNYKSFIKHLGNYTESSCKAGIMQLQYKEWLLGDNGTIYTGEDLIRLLKQVEGRSIDIYWIDDNKGKVIKAMVYDCNDGRFICEALPKPISARAKAEEQEHHREARTIMAKYRSTVTAYMQQQKNKIDKVTVIDNRPTTVSNSFSIEGFETYIPSTKAVEVMETQEEEIIYNPNAHTTVKRWREAF